MSVSPSSWAPTGHVWPGWSAEGGGIEPYPTPFPGQLVSNQIPEPVRLPSVCSISGPTGNRTRIPATPGRCLPVGRSARLFQWTAWESNPSHRPCKGQSPPTACRPVIKRSARDLNPAFRPTTTACRLKHLQTSCGVIPAGIEPALSWMSARRLRRWTTGSCQ